MSELVLKSNYLSMDISQDDRAIFNYQLINKFIDYADVNTLTIRCYKTYIRHFIKWLLDNDIRQPKRDDIKAYKKYLDTTNLSVGTKNQYLRAVKLLFKWLSSEGIYFNIADNIKSFKSDNTKHKKDALSSQEIKKLLDDIDTSNIEGKRDKAILLLMAVGGLRINEVRLMDIKDITTRNDRHIIYIQGKNHTEKDDYIYVIDDVYKVITDYLDARGNYNASDVLFTSASNNSFNKRLSREYLSKLIKHRLISSGFNSRRITAHSIRHSTASILIKNGSDLITTQHYLRHLDPKTTEIYINEDNKDKDTSAQDVYNAIYGTASDKANIKELKENINTLTPNQVLSVLDYIKSIKDRG
jgi:integrase/recombinase XerD